MVAARVVRYQVEPEETETVLGLLGEMAAATRTEEANISCDFFQGVEDPAQIVILERRTIQTFEVTADA
ncbi:hypothetical protein ASG77_00370 [Arthrobacter sp. Soil762]|nr:hypothetical protein ASG77_00370 [Arthrobacter sp. Soil762]